MADLIYVGASAIMVLPNGTWIDKKHYDELRREIEDALRWLPEGVVCRIEHLVTPRFWLGKPPKLRRGLGRCLAYWVAGRELPLRFVGAVGKPQKRYQKHIW